MEPKKYIESAKITETKDYSIPKKRVTEDTLRLLHGAIGIATESGELLSPIKAHVFYGKELDKTNLKEELGDILWYIAITADELDISFEELMEKNIAKLKARYGDKFSEHMAKNRNLDNERKILE